MVQETGGLKAEQVKGFDDGDIESFHLGVVEFEISLRYK